MQIDRIPLARAQRAVVLQVLTTDRPVARDALESVAALERLQAEGVLVIEGERVRASRSARHLDALGLIAV
jgi:hypothetical protein